MSWIKALKIYNRNKPVWCIPRKGTEEHAQVKAIMENLKQQPKPKPKKKIIKKKVIKKKVIKKPTPKAKPTPKKLTDAERLSNFKKELFAIIRQDRSVMRDIFAIYGRAEEWEFKNPDGSWNDDLTFEDFGQGHDVFGHWSFREAYYDNVSEDFWLTELMVKHFGVP